MAEHNKDTDAWMVLKDKVYDVTHYINYHPGGKPKIMMAVGKDGTSLFCRNKLKLETIYIGINYFEIKKLKANTLFYSQVSPLGQRALSFGEIPGGLFSAKQKEIRFRAKKI